MKNIIDKQPVAIPAIAYAFSDLLVVKSIIPSTMATKPTTPIQLQKTLNIPQIIETMPSVELGLLEFNVCPLLS